MANLKDLDTLIPQYAINKSEMEDYKKLCDAENAQIKALMKEFTVQHYETGEYKATYSVSHRENLNEETLLSLFTTVPGFVKIAEDCGIVKERPYIDFDALEKAIYDGKLSTEQLSELNKSKEVVTLKVTKINKKKGKEDD